MFIIGFYFFVFVYIFHIGMLIPYSFQIILIISLLMIGLNFMSDYKNFEDFLIGINNFMDSAKQKDILKNSEKSA